MNKLWTRRQFLKRSGAFGLLASGIFLGGCNKSTPVATENSETPVPDATADPVKTAKILTLEYDDSPEFYANFDKAINAGTTVDVLFDGTHKLDAKSKLFERMKNQEKKSFEALVQSIRSLDNKEGRQELSNIFDSSLLEHEKLVAPITTPNGEVIEPGTIMLIAVVFLCAMTLVETFRGRRISSIRFPGGGVIQFEPMSA